MSQPAPLYVDDTTIRDDEPLWRRIPPVHCIFDNNLQCWRPSSAAFEDHPNGTPMSVVLGQEVIASGRDSAAVLHGHQGYALASFIAAIARSHSQGIARRPLSEEPAHARRLEFGPKDLGKVA